MKVYIAFLIGTFVIAGSRHGNRPLRRPILLVGLCVVVAASYWSRRVVG
jgi:hypothetical protein